MIFLQGVSAMRLGERELHRLPGRELVHRSDLGPSAMHTNPAGSRLAIQHFNEYLELFPDDVGVRWLLESLT